MRTFSAVGVTACAHRHSYWRGKIFIVIHLDRVPTRNHQETTRAANFLCAAAPPHQRHRVLLALLTPPPCLKTDIELFARALITTHDDAQYPAVSLEHAAVPWVAQPAGATGMTSKVLASTVQTKCAW